MLSGSGGVYTCLRGTVRNVSCVCVCVCVCVYFGTDSGILNLDITACIYHSKIPGQIRMMFIRQLA